MRKIFALVLALTLLAVPLYAAVAVGVDLSGMTDEELTALKQQLDAEMLDRGMVKTAILPMGTYTIGVDIPKGEYTLINDTNNEISTYFHYASSDDFKNGVVIECDNLDGLNSAARVTLTDGQILQISDNTVRISVFSIQWQ